MSYNCRRYSDSLPNYLIIPSKAIFMTKKVVKKIFLYSLSVFLLLIVVLGIHIYMVTRPKAPDAYTRAMARIDIKQPINTEDCTKIGTWLHQQKGVDNVLVNPQTAIVVFTFFPIKTTANQIVHDFKAALPYKAERFVPTAAELQGGCPVASTSATYKIYNFLNHLF